MYLRLLTAAVFVLAIYIAFGDALQASVLGTPESFVSNIGHGIGATVSGIASAVGGLVGS